MNCPAMTPQRRPNRSNTRPPCPLLLPQLPACAAHFALLLGLVRSRPLSRQIVPHRFMQQVRIHPRRENIVGQLQLPHRLPAQIRYIYDGHIRLVISSLSLFLRKCTRPSDPALRRAQKANFRPHRSSQLSNSSTSSARFPNDRESAGSSTRATETSSPRFRPARDGTSSHARHLHRRNASASRRPQIRGLC